MDPFVRQLVQRLHDPKRPLSRNRHFHTFATPEGKRALQTSRRLRSLQRDILACHRAGRPTCIRTEPLPEGGSRVELRMEEIHGSRISHLHPEEFELLLDMPGVREALAGTRPAPHGPRPSSPLPRTGEPEGTSGSA